MKPSVQDGQVLCGGQVLSARTIYGLIFAGERWQGSTCSVTGSDLAATGLSFSEFPCTPGLHVQAILGADGPKILLGLMGREGNEVFPVASPADYLIAGTRWIPLPIGTQSAMTDLLETIGLKLGLISIGQYLRLLQKPLSVEIWDEAASLLASEKFSFQLSVPSPSGLQARLYPYQENGYRWLDFMARSGVGTILADEMGLGKTLQVIAVILAETQRRDEPNLVVCPATLLENWRRECAKFAPSLRVLIHLGRLRTGYASELNAFNVVVCSYETMVSDISMFREITWNLLVIDEAQAIKNPEAQRTVKIKRVPRRTAIAVTGTPVENTLRDIWSISDFVAPGQLGTLEEFERRFPDTVDHANQLEPLISAMMLRRRVRNVAQDLPERIDIPVPLQMDELQARAYEEIRGAASSRSPKATDFTAMVPLRMYCAHPWAAQKLLGESPFSASPKLIHLFAILEEVIGNGEKALVFTSFQAVADLIARLVYERWAIFVAVIDGRVPVLERQRLVDALAAATPSGVLLLNPKAAGVGLNITSANHVIHYNLEWNPAVEDQASARSYRRGQERPVTVHRLFYVDTVEEVIDDRMRRKRNLSESAVLGTDGASVDVDDLYRALTISPLKK
jgi:SNF2 family DNA or RNA helicase